PRGASPGWGVALGSPPWTRFELAASGAHLPTARDREAATGVRAAKKVLRWKYRCANPPDHFGPASFAVDRLLFRPAVFAPFLAADAERRAGDRPQSLDRDRLSALSTQRTQVATIRRSPARFFLSLLNKVDV